MTGLWLLSYVVLWVLLLVALFLLYAILREIGRIHLKIGTATPPTPTMPILRDDGPAIGTAVPGDVYESVNTPTAVSLSAEPGRLTLLMFLSPMCSTCQEVIDPLNTVLLINKNIDGRVIMASDRHACLSFYNVFPVRVPLICDDTRQITQGFGVHRNPFALLYDGAGMLIRKGTILSADHILALLDPTTASEGVLREIYPSESLLSSEVLLSEAG